MPLRIFIVEDHPVMREMLGALLRQEPDFEVSGAAATAEEALERLAEKSADLLLVDVSLPKMSGIELVQEVQRRGLELRCLMLTWCAV